MKDASILTKESFERTKEFAGSQVVRLVLFMETFPDYYEKNLYDRAMEFSALFMSDEDFKTMEARPLSKEFLNRVIEDDEGYGGLKEGYWD